MDDAELQPFYEDLVFNLREKGILCAITSGLACVHYELAQNTKDCDLLCHHTAFGQLLEELGAIKLEGQPCRYRGHLSPPLDWGWHAGGWTSHFQWGSGPDAVTLDVFGQALRGSTAWPAELAGLYINPHIVAEMKRTHRDKDWPYITLLGERLLEMGDPRGWLHLFDADTLRRLARVSSISPELLDRRPCLRLALDRDDRLAPVLKAEQILWIELDRLRLEIYRRALRPYNLAVIRSQEPADMPLPDQHHNRVRCAQEKLACSPLVEHGLARHLMEAKAATARLVRPELMDWLPDLAVHHSYLET